MATAWFTSDTHFGHNMLAKDIRGFDSTDEHDEVLISNCNSVIKPEDTVFHLGDFSLKNPSTNREYLMTILSRLNGNWHLIAGNHDACWPGHRDSYKHQKTYLELGFHSVQAFGKRKLDGEYILMSHFPYLGDHTKEDRETSFRLRNEGLTLLHGHTHLNNVISWDYYPEALQVHVGLDAWNLMPISIDQVHSLIKDNK